LKSVRKVNDSLSVLPNGKGSEGHTGNQVASERQAKLQKEKDDLEAARRAQPERDAAGDGGDGGEGGDKGGDGTDKNLPTEGGDENKGNDAEKKTKRVRAGPLVPDTVIGKTLKTDSVAIVLRRCCHDIVYSSKRLGATPRYWTGGLSRTYSWSKPRVKYKR